MLQTRDRAITWPKTSEDRFIPRRISLNINDFNIYSAEAIKDLDELGSHNTSCSSLLKFNLADIQPNMSKKQFFKYRDSKEKVNILDALEETSKTGINTNQRKKFVLPKKPYKVLEVPNISDDFYHNIFAWSASNLFSVNLDNNIYLLHGETGAITKLYEAFDCETVTCLQWNDNGDQLAMGNILGQVSIWDIHTQKEITNFDSHEDRICAMDWRSTLISGSRDTNIVQHDFREKSPQTRKFFAHTQEVCKLKWSPDEQMFASGGNDTSLFVWSPQSALPVMKESHMACVKALAWSETQHGVLASGGGAADKMIKTWNVRTKELIHERLTDSQVCSLVYSKYTNDLISAHGFPNNEINIWRANGLKKVGSLMGHTERVLYLNFSPCATTLVSCSGDETMRFWKLYDGFGEKCGKRSERLLELSKMR